MSIHASTSRMQVGWEAELRCRYERFNMGLERQWASPNRKVPAELPHDRLEPILTYAALCAKVIFGCATPLQLPFHLN